VILHIDGRFYSQLTTGVQRYGRELLTALDPLVGEHGLPAPFTAVRLHRPITPHTATPSFRNVDVLAYGRRSGHAWEQLELPGKARGGVLFCPGNTAPLRSLLSGTRVVVTLHDLSYRSFPQAYTRRYRLWYHLVTPVIVRRAARIITVSQSEREAIIRPYPMARDRLVVIQNGGAPAPTFRRKEPPLEKPYVLYVGALSMRKNFPGVVKAFERLGAERRELRLVVIGSSPDVYSHLPPPAAPGVRERIAFLGQVEDDGALEAAYRGASCLVFASFYEASPLPPIEAMAYGCPVVAADIPSLRERCGEAAVYCDPHDPQGIARAVAHVLDDQALAGRLRQAGAARAALFTWRDCAERTLAILAEVGASHDPAGS
jgi:glycosyltransferase involved in cell wall biosynthesis